MSFPRKLAVAVVAGGIGLGAVLGAAASPIPKRPPEPQQQAPLQLSYLPDAGYALVQGGPEDLSPYPDRYAPSWANEELANWEPVYPPWTYSDFAADPPADSEGQASEDTETAPPPAASEPLAADPQIEGSLDALY